MRAIREVPFAAALALLAGAMFFGGGPGDTSLVWLAAVALTGLVAAAAVYGAPPGLLWLLPLAALVAWLALTIAWSTLPDRSWDYANRGLVYLVAAVLGLYLAGRTRALAHGLAVVLGAVAVWSLLGKVLPPVYDYGGPEVTRLRGPVGLWNQLALLGCFALPLALWRRRLAGTLLAYVWLVALLLTYSRGGLLTALAVLVAWLVLSDARIESAWTLVAAAVPAAAIVGFAFLLPGVTSDAQSTHVRWRDGILFGVVLAAGAVGAASLERLPRPRMTRGRLRALAGLGALAVVAAIAVVIAKGTGSTSVSNSGSHLTSTSSNFRFVWWEQAWHGFTHHVLAGTGAGTFRLTNLLYRDSFVDVTTEPHDLPLQFLSETGVIGLALLVAAMGALIWRARGRSGHELALSLVLPAYLLHSLVDIDWDFAAVSVPAFLVAGALAGRLLVARASPYAALAVAGAGLLVFGSLLLPWLGERWSNDAAGTFDVKLAERARSVDPLLVDPLWTIAFAYDAQPALASAYYQEAVDKQPHNPRTWLLAGLYALDNGCPRRAYNYLEKFTELDNKARPELGGDAYRRALALVNTGKPTC
jgi:hypothetical protein